MLHPTARCVREVLHSGVPTKLERTTITHVPRVQRLLDAGHQIWPEKSSKEVIIELAERGLESAEAWGIDSLMMFPGRSGGLTAAEVEDALLDD